VRAELLSEPRYGLTATTCEAVIDGELRECIVVLGGFTRGGYTGEDNLLMVLMWTPQEGVRLLRKLRAPSVPKSGQVLLSSKKGSELGSCGHSDALNEQSTLD
jgi:hypothetical protein